MNHSEHRAKQICKLYLRLHKDVFKCAISIMPTVDWTARTKRVARIIRAIRQRYPSGFPVSWLGMNIE